MMRYRKITLPNGVWKYFVGKGSVEIRGPNGERHNPHCCDLLGITGDEWDRGKWKRWAHITPANVKRWIETRGN